MMTDSNNLVSVGTIREIFCLLLLLSFTCMVSIFLHTSDFTLQSGSFLSEPGNYEEWLVQWRPSYNDSSVSYLQDVEAGMVFIFNPTAFTGADFYATLMKDLIVRDGRTDVKIMNLLGFDKKSEPLEYQTRLLKRLFFDSQLSHSYIISQAHVSDMFYHDSFQMTRHFKSVSFIRHPFVTFVASFYYHHHGQVLFSSGNETRKQFLTKLAQAVDEVEKYVESGKEFRVYANGISAVVPFCGWNNSRCSGVHQGRAPQIIARAKKNSQESNTFIGIMEDYTAIPALLEKLSPSICKGLTRYAESHVEDFPPWLDTKIYLKRSVQERLKKDNRLKLEIRFYEWVKERYYKEKKDLLKLET